MKSIADWLKARKIMGLIWLMIQAAFISLVPAMFFFYVVVPNDWNTLPEEETDKRLKDLQYIFGLLATWSFYTAMNGYRDMIAAVKMRRTEDFQKEYFKRISPVLDGIMGFVALAILWMKMRVAYESDYEGAETIFKTFFIMYVLRQFTMGLDDPSRSILYEKEIPPDMLQAARERERQLENEKK